MAQNALKRVISEPKDEAMEGHTRKMARKNTVSEDVVKEFLKLTGVKQTRLKGFKQFLTTLKSAAEKHEIILKYLQSHPDCPEMFEVLSESSEERSLFEVQIVVEILEIIVLQLVKDDMKTKSQATVIVSRLLASHRKLINTSLNSPSPANFTIAVLKLLIAIVMHGPALAREMLSAFDFSHKRFGALANRRDKKVVVDVRSCFIKLVLSFFVTGDPQLVQQVLQIKGFATSMLHNLHKDSAEIIHLTLSTLLTKIVENRSILKKNKILLFNSYSLSQLARLYTYEDDNSIREKIHHFLLKLCASPHGISFENKLGIFSDRSNNPVLLRFLHSLRKAVDDNLLSELIIRILQRSQDLISPFLSGYQMVLDPRNSKQWLNNLKFIIKLYFHLPMPRSILKELAISADHVSTVKHLTIVCPENIKRNILNRGLQHPDAVVQSRMLSMLLVILRRSCNLIQSNDIDDRILISFCENIMKHLPNFQTLISIRENLNNRTKETRVGVGENFKDLPPQLSIQDATILLSRTLACMSLFQILSPHCFTQSNYDPWKLLPQTKQEETLYNLSSKYSMLRIFQSCPARHFKWQPQLETVTSIYFKQILQLHCHEEDTIIVSMTRDLLNKFLIETGVGYSNKLEVSIWLRNLLDDRIHERDTVINFFGKVYCRLAGDPFSLVDDVIESVHSVNMTPSAHFTEGVEKSSRALTFTPIVPCALKLFASLVKDTEEQNGSAENLDNLARYLNLVLLDILDLQTDPRSLCNMIVKSLAQDDMTLYPLHTKLLLDFVTHWSTIVNEGDLEISGTQKVSEKKETKEQAKLNLSPRQFRKQITFSDQIDTSFVISYLKCNPVLFDFENSTKFVKVLNGLPCFLLARQLLMFVFKYWNSATEISDNAALWDTLNSIVAAILVAAKQESIKSWERNVSSILFLVSNVVEMYLDNSRNQPVVLEISRTVTELLRMIFDRLREVSSSNSVRKMDLDTYDEIESKVGNDDVVHDDCITNSDVTSNDVIHEDVINAIDKTCYLKSPDENVQNDRKVLEMFMNMVFERDVLKHFFYGHVGVKRKIKNDAGYNFVWKVISNCAGELLRHFHGEILQEKNSEYLKSYFLRIAQAVKEEHIDYQEMDMKLPYNVSSIGLLRMFHQYLSSYSLNEILQAYLDTPKEQFIKIQDSPKETVLSRSGEKIVEVLKCFINREENDYDDLLSDVLDGIFHLLMSLDCPECDEIIVMFATKYSGLSDTALSAVLNHCLNQPTCVRIQTAVLVICQRTALLIQFEDWVLNRVDGKSVKKRDGRKEILKFLQSESEWDTFLPLLLFYLSVIRKGPGATLTEQNKKCLHYIYVVSWQRIRDWLLEMKNIENSNDCLKMLSLLLDGGEIDSDMIHNLYTQATIKEHFIQLNSYQLEAVESILQYVLKVSTNEKHQKKWRTIFVCSCMQRLTGIMKNDKEYGPLRLKILHYLEIYGKESLKLKKTESFSIEDFLNVTNTFVKSALRFCFTCSQTLHVLSILGKTIYTNCSNKLLLPPTDLYQFVLNHSKFLEIFLGNTNTTDVHENAKEALVDLLQTVVDLEPKCCEPLHVFLILGAYTATLSLSDQKLLRLLFTYEVNLGDVALGSRVLWGEAAIEAYRAGKSGPTTLWHETNITQILDLLDSKHLLQSAKHFPQYKPLQPDLFENFHAESQFYDPSFLLPVFSFFLAPGCEVNCRRFIESSALAYVICAVTSREKEMRQLAYQILSRFQQHLFQARFREQQQVTHLLHFFQNGITKADCRMSSLMASFMTRTLHIFFYPEDPLYPSVNRYMLQRSFMDLRDVPLFLSHLNNSDLSYRTERTWLLHLILDGLRDPMDYHICKKFQVFQHLFTLYSSAIADKGLQKLILKIALEVCRHHASAYDLCENYGFISWLHLLINTNSGLENFGRLVNILSTLWFTLIGTNKSHEESNDNNYQPFIPKNVCSELFLVLLSILQSTTSSEMFNAEILTSFTSLLVSLLEHQQRWTTSAEITITKQQCIQICQLWRSLFGNIDIYKKLHVFITKDVSASHKEISSEKWFISMRNVLKILTNSDGIQDSVKLEEPLSMNLNLLKVEGTFFDRYLKGKLHSALQTFMTISDSSVWTKDQVELLLLSRVLSKGVIQ